MPTKNPVLLAAPTRSTKGVGAVIPHCLNYPRSMVLLDVKLGKFEVTSKYRSGKRFSGS